MLLCFIALLVSISAAPSKDHGKSYKVHRHAVGSGPKNGVLALEKAYRRRNWTPPEGLNAAVAFHEDVVADPVHSTIKEDVATGGGGKGSGAVTAKAYGTDTEYLCPVRIGQRTFNMVRLPQPSVSLFKQIGSTKTMSWCSRSPSKGTTADLEKHNRILILALQICMYSSYPFVKSPF